MVADERITRAHSVVDGQECPFIFMSCKETESDLEVCIDFIFGVRID